MVTPGSACPALVTLPVNSAVVPCCAVHGTAISNKRAVTTLFNGSPFEAGALQESGESRVGTKRIEYRLGLQAERIRAIAQALLQQREDSFPFTQPQIDDGD